MTPGATATQLYLPGLQANSRKPMADSARATCVFCGRGLRASASVRCGIGPTCRRARGLKTVSTQRATEQHGEQP